MRLCVCARAYIISRLPATWLQQTQALGLVLLHAGSSSCSQLTERSRKKCLCCLMKTWALGKVAIASPPLQGAAAVAAWCDVEQQAIRNSTRL